MVDQKFNGPAFLGKRILISWQGMAKYHSIEEIIAVLDDEDDYSCNLIAATYALQATEEADYGINSENIEAHLDVLKDHGAVFNMSTAIGLAHYISLESAREEAYK